MKRNLTIRNSILAVCLWLATTVVAGPKLHRMFTIFNSANGLADNSAQTIKCTRTGRMVITTIGHVNFYDGQKFNHADPEPEDYFDLPRYKGHYHLYFDKHHHIWLKDKYTVTCLDLLTEHFVANVDSVFKSLGMKHRVDDLFADIDNHLWLMSGQTLYGIDDDKQFPIRQQSDLHDVDVYDGRVLLQFFANGVVTGYDIATGRHLFDVAAGASTKSVPVAKSSVILPDSNMFYQIRNAEKNAVLLSFDVKRRQWRELMSVPYHLNNLVKERGMLYIASQYGFWTYSLLTGEGEHTAELRMKGGRKLSTDVNVICFDRQGGMWLGTEKRGLLYSRRYKSPFVTFTFDQPEAQYYLQLLDDSLSRHPQDSLPRHVNCMFRDSRGWTWTGTYTGLKMQKRDGGPVVTFTRKDGLLNEMVHSVIEDQQHDIWLSTSYGVSHLFIRADSVYHVETYNHDDNVPIESFVKGRAMLMADGTIVMQSLDHVLAFHPSNFYATEIKDIELFPKLVRLMVNGHYLEPGMKLDGRVILERTITRIWEFAVNYNQNSISMVFSGLNYLRPVQTYYRVRVKGVIDDWRIYSHNDGDGFVDGKGLLHLPLTGLRPGSYEVEVQASMTPDHWPVKPFKWTVHVQQPWWRSTGIYLLMGLLLLALIVGNVLYYNRNLRLRLTRNNHEEDIVRRIAAFTERCESMMGETLAPNLQTGQEDDIAANRLDKHFEEAMLKMMPYMQQHRGHRVTISNLSEVSGLQVSELYELLSANLYKGPSQLLVRLKLQQGAKLLAERDVPIEDIARQCGFASPNHFIAAFYHHYRQTPLDYRNSMPR